MISLQTLTKPPITHCPPQTPQATKDTPPTSAATSQTSSTSHSPPLRQSPHILHQNLRFKKPLLRQLSVIRTPLEPIEDLEQMIEVDPKHFASLRKSSKKLSISWHHAFGEINGLRKKNIMHAHDCAGPKIHAFIALCCDIPFDQIKKFGLSSSSRDENPKP